MIIQRHIDMTDINCDYCRAEYLKLPPRHHGRRTRRDREGFVAPDRGRGARRQATYTTMPMGRHAAGSVAL